MFRYTPLAAIVLMLAVSMGGLAAHEENDGITFVLTVNEHPDADASGKEMLQEAHGPGGIIELTADKSCQLWSSDQAAVVDLSFPAQPVAYNIETTIGQLTTITATVGVVAGNTFTGVASAQGPTGTIDLTSPLAIDVGEYVGFQVCAEFGGLSTSTDIFTTDGASHVTFTDAPPPTYPTPELGTLLLSGVGLLGVVGMTRIRGRR